MSGWDDPEAPVYYEAFCRAHSRYARANAALIAHAHIAPGMRVLDLAAGTGRTAEAALDRLGDDGRIVCVEPAAPMREEGARRVRDRRVAWRASLSEAIGPEAIGPEAIGPEAIGPEAMGPAMGPFDRILCGAAIWQLEPLDATIRTLGGLLCRGGALCFNIPALYLLEPDEPGGGGDPLLLDLPALLAANAGAACDMPQQQSTRQSTPPLAAGAIRSWLREAGLGARSWRFRVRLTQEAYAAWLKIPAVAGRMLAGLSPGERARRIDAALDAVDRSGWKWERWRGWTAWKP